MIESTARAFNEALIKYDVNFRQETLFDGYKWTFPGTNGDVALHSGTYGAREGYVESYCFPWDNGDVTVCPPEEMARRIAGYTVNPDMEYNYSLGEILASFDFLRQEVE